MGLDMYLRGRKHHFPCQNEMNNVTEDGFLVVATELDLGYWRKHPNLHGFIVHTFAEGVDECQPISLNIDQLNMTISAIKHEQLIPTTGFFFGKSQGTKEQQFEDLRIMEAARDWLARIPNANEYRTVYYQASW